MTLVEPVEHAGGSDAVVASLLAGASLTQAADAAGVSRSTVVRRLRDPQVRRQLDKARREVLARTLDRLTELSLDRSSRSNGCQPMTPSRPPPG